MTRTRVDLAALARVEADVGAAVTRIEERLAELRAGLAPLSAVWSGEAAARWDGHQRRWDAAAADLTASLGTLHALLARARAGYAAAIDANVRTWRR